MGKIDRREKETYWYHWLHFLFAAGKSNIETFEWGTIYPTPPLGQDMTQGQFLSGV